MNSARGGGPRGRYYADGADTIHPAPDSRNPPTDFTESRFPFPVEPLRLVARVRAALRRAGG